MEDLIVNHHQIEGKLIDDGWKCLGAHGLPNNETIDGIKVVKYSRWTKNGKTILLYTEQDQTYHIFYPSDNPDDMLTEAKEYAIPNSLS